MKVKLMRKNCKVVLTVDANAVKEGEIKGLISLAEGLLFPGETRNNIKVIIIKN